MKKVLIAVLIIIALYLIDKATGPIFNVLQDGTEEFSIQQHSNK